LPSGVSVVLISMSSLKIAFANGPVFRGSGWKGALASGNWAAQGNPKAGGKGENGNGTRCLVSAKYVWTHEGIVSPASAYSATQEKVTCAFAHCRKSIYRGATQIRGARCSSSSWSPPSFGCIHSLSRRSICPISRPPAPQDHRHLAYRRLHPPIPSPRQNFYLESVGAVKQSDPEKPQRSSLRTQRHSIC